MKQIYKFLMEYCQKGNVIFLLILQCVYVFISFLSPEIFKNGIDAIENRNMDGLAYTVLLAMIYMIMYTVVDFSIRICNRKLVNLGEKNLEVRLLTKALELQTGERHKMDVGKFLTISLKNSANAIESAVSYLLSMFGGIAIVVLSLVYMGFLQWQLTLMLVMYHIIWREVSKRMKKKIKQYSKDKVGAIQKSNSFLINILYNMMTIRIYDKERFFNEKWFDCEKNVLKKEMKRFVWSNGLQDSTWAVMKLSEFLILYGIGGYFVYTGDTTMGVLLAFTFAIYLFINGLDKVTSAVSAKAEAVNNMEMVEELLNNLNVEEGRDERITEKDFAISVRDVSFSYGSKKVLENVSFDIYPGEHVLLIGENGGGKSTLLNLLCGIYRPDSGTISYGGHDTSFISLKSMAEKYAYVSQESNIIETNTFENITMDEAYDKEKVTEVLKELNIENTVHINPMSASQGEKQRINIGRALYKAEQSSILVGDEIFANVDMENAVKIVETLERTFRDRTIIMVAHTQMPMKFDKIINVANGQVMVKEAVANE